MTCEKTVELILQGLTTLASMVVPIVLLVVGNRVTSALKDREIKAKYVEVAITILSKAPDAEQQDGEQKALRKWAMEVVNTYADIKLPESTERALIDRIPLAPLGSGMSINVVDTSGQPVSGATVRLVEDSGGVQTVRVSVAGGIAGLYRLGYGYASGSMYRISVKADGFQDFLSEAAAVWQHNNRIVVLQPDGRPDVESLAGDE